MITKTLTGFVSALALGAVLVTVAMPADAHGGKRGGGERASFSELDANGDGQLTQEEMLAFAQTRFNERDTNGDGGLSQDEMLAALEEDRQERAERRIERMIDRADANDDGLLQFDEIGPKDDGDKRFARMDANEDGVISEEEFAEMGKRGGRGKGPRGE
jgi:Ca2+-binding EF-hand superfamily protein